MSQRLQMKASPNMITVHRYLKSFSNWHQAHPLGSGRKLQHRRKISAINSRLEKSQHFLWSTGSRSGWSLMDRSQSRSKPILGWIQDQLNFHKSPSLNSENVLFLRRRLSPPSSWHQNTTPTSTHSCWGLNKFLQAYLLSYDKWLFTCQCLFQVSY